MVTLCLGFILCFVSSQCAAVLQMSPRATHSLQMSHCEQVADVKMSRCQAEETVPKYTIVDQALWRLRIKSLRIGGASNLFGQVGSIRELLTRDIT